MGRIPNFIMEPKRKEFFASLTNPAFVMLTEKEQASKIGVDASTISRWTSAMSPEEWQEITSLRDKLMARDMLEIDASMIAQAKAGEVEAAKLVYQKLGGWSPKQVNENINKDEFAGMTTEEKIKKVSEILAKRAGKVDLGVVPPVDGEKKADNG